MAKDFKKNMQQSIGGGVDSLIPSAAPATPSEPEKPKRGRPKTQTKEVTKTSELGTKENETRATFIVNKGALEKVKDIAYWERSDIKEVVGVALEDYINRYEQEHGTINPRRKKK